MRLLTSQPGLVSMLAQRRLRPDCDIRLMIERDFPVPNEPRLELELPTEFSSRIDKQLPVSINNLTKCL
jgi:hypothetical protein